MPCRSSVEPFASSVSVLMTSAICDGHADDDGHASTCDLDERDLPTGETDGRMHGRAHGRRLSRNRAR